jgi:hypothetical protein
LNNVELDLPKATDASKLFVYCTSLEEITLDLPEATNISQLFTNCNHLTHVEISAPKVTSINNIQNIFGGCGMLESVKVDLSSATDLSYQNNGLFYDGVASLNMLNHVEISAPKATNTQKMFYGCSGLVEIDGVVFPASTNNSNLFTYCSNLESVYNLNVSGQTTAMEIFYSCNNLMNITFAPDYNGIPNTIKGDFRIIHSNYLTHDTLMNIIYALGVVSSTKKLTLLTSLVNTLQPEEIAIATSKNWSVISY